ncbi:SRPBCC family protein [Acinetobacter guillouiae]|uniref:SRPBCC family protein n=1 Tax=Acinetobacter guillouiae TaxID=106649 RepID=UPI003AF9A87F
MKFEITTEILINAPIDIVWKTLTNFEDYKNWNPFIINVSGETHQGGKINVTIQNDATSKMSFKALVLENQENKQFSWRGKLLVKGIFDGEHKFRLEQISNNQTRLIHSEAFSGILVKPFLKNLQTKTKPGFERMNHALKVKLESQ